MTSKNKWNERWRLAVVASLMLFTLMIPLSLFMVSLSAILLLITLIGKKATDKPRVIVVPPFSWTILAFLLVAALSLLFSPYPTPVETWLGLKKLRYFGYYFLFFYGLYETRELKLPIITFIIGCAFSSILAWSQYWFGQISFVTLFNHDLMQSPYMEKMRAIGFMSHHRRFSMTIGLAIPLVCSLAIHLKYGWRYKLLSFFLIVLFSGAMLWTHGKGVIIAIVVSSLIVSWIRSWKLGLLTIGILSLTAFLLIITIPKDVSWLSPKFFTASSEILNESLGESLSESPAKAKSSNDIRVILWKTSLSSFIQNPIFGIGWGQFKHEREKIDLSIKGADKYPHSHPHSELLWVGVELGIVGLAIFMFFWSSLILRLFNAYRRIDGLNRDAKVLLYIGIWCSLFWLISGLTDVALLNSENAAALWFVLALSTYALFMKKRAREVRI